MASSPGPRIPLCRPQCAVFDSGTASTNGADRVQPSVPDSKSGLATTFSSTPGGGAGSQVDVAMPMSIIPGPKVIGMPVVWNWNVTIAVWPLKIETVTGFAD